VSLKAGAPRAFRSALRAPLNARETRSTLPAGRVSGAGYASGLHFVCLDRVSRAYRLGAPGLCPPDVLPARGRASGGWGRQRIPAPPSTQLTGWGRCNFVGYGQLCPCPTPGPSSRHGSSASHALRPVTACLLACQTHADWLWPDRISGSSCPRFARLSEFID